MIATTMAKGILTWIPGLQKGLYNRHAAAGTHSASYCYGVWIKHLALLRASGMPGIPRRVLELGPGVSLGTGIAALLSGAEQYHAIDAIAHVQPGMNLEVFRALAGRFHAREPAPRGFPPITEQLDGRGFPGGILDDAQLRLALAPERLSRIEQSLRRLDAGQADGMIRYHTWDELYPLPGASVDLLFSHVVLNQVLDLERMYRVCGRVVAPGGWMSHQIDFTSHHSAREWNGHLAYGDLAWKVICGQRPYFVNRERLGRHLALLEENGFVIERVIRGHAAGGLKRAELAPRFRGISEEDLVTQTGFVVARRR